MNRKTMPIVVVLVLVVAAFSISGVWGATSSDTPSNSATAPSEKGASEKSAHEKPAPAKAAANPTVSLDSVQWAGPGVELSNLQGKTTIVMTFVTWCPICNGWAPEMVDQLKKAIEDKSVVVIAIGTDVNAAQAKDFIIKKGLVAPNVLYGASAKMNESLGVDPKNLWNYVWIDPDGKVKTKGTAGSAYAGANTKDYVLPHELTAAKDLGKLQFVAPAMSATVKSLAWSMEMGNLSLLVKISQPKNLRGLAKEDQEALQDLSTRFLDEQLASAKQLLAGDLLQKMDGYDKASQLSAVFHSTPQGKEANLLVLDLNGDATFKKEVAARNLYQADVAKAGGDDVKLVKSLHVVVQRFPETHYGDLAKKKIDDAAVVK